MAVTAIRKASSSILVTLSAISLVVFAVFFFGGSEINAEGNKVYAYTELLLYWSYVLLGLAALSTLVFAVKSLIESFGRNPKNALISVGGFVALVALLLVTYLMGDTTPIPGNDEGGFNTEGWLKLTDMWIYSTYVLVGLNVLAVLWGGVKGFVNK